MEKSTLLCNGKGSNADKVQDSETSLLVSKKADKNYIEDTETTPKSCVSASSATPSWFWSIDDKPS